MTRNWTGQDNSSQFGNGWTNTSQPYLVVDKQDPDPIIEEIVDGVTQDAFAESTTSTTVDGTTTYNYSETALYQSADTLVYIPPTEETVDGETVDTPARYQLTDSAGNITTFNGLPRNTDGVLTDANVYPQEPMEQSDGTYYRIGAFVSFQDTYGNLTSTQYDPTTGNLLEVDRSDAVSGQQQRFVYSYATCNNSEGGSASMISQVILEQRASSADSWSNVEGADYTYYTGDGSDSAYGRLGDLKTVTTWNLVDDTSHITGGDYYRYYKFWGTTYDSDTTYAEAGPTDDPSTCGGTDVTYPRYYHDSADVVIQSGLSVVVQGENFTRMMDAYGTIDNVDEQLTASLVPYANNTFEYQRYQYTSIQPENYGTGYQVISETSEGGGCSCMGNDGVGTFTYSYTFNTDSTYSLASDVDFSASGNPLDTTYTFNPNVWVVKTVVGLPSTTPGATTSDNEDIVYTNGIGEVLLSVAVDGTTAEPTYYRYDENGRLIMTVNPSAMAAYNVSAPASYEDYPDLVGFNSASNTYANILPNTGLISTTTYGTTTTATSSIPGSVAGYVESQAVQQGYAGTPIITASQQYIARTDADSGVTIYPVASETVYRNNDGSGAETTTYTYGWSGDTDAETEVTVTEPIVSATENGSGTAATTETYYDSYGRPVWTVDANGYITYTKYDTATGAIVEQVQDVNPTTITDPSVTGPTRSSSLPTALALTTTTQVDGLGRATKVTDPDGNVTYYAYDDGNFAVFAFPGATQTLDGSGNGTLTTTGPAQMLRERIPYTATDGVTYDYTETMTLSGTFTVSDYQIVLPGFIRGDGASTGGYNVLNLTGVGSTDSPQFTIQSLSRQLYNTGGQMVESDAYSTLSNATYLATADNSPYSGTAITTSDADGNYNPTLYGYDGQGNQDRVVSPDGTITRTVYDGLGRINSEWVGTDDTISGGWWSTSTPGNLVDVEDFYYDGGSASTSPAGDGNLTETVEHPGGGEADRATLMYYDWRDRLVAEKKGALLNEDGSENLSGEMTAAAGDPITYTTYDNIGEPIEDDTYDGDGIAVITVDGVPAQPSATTLQAQSVASYDDRGQVNQTQEVGVDSSTGTMATVTGLTDGTPYYFAVKGANAGDTSSASNIVEATPASGETGAPVLDNVIAGEGDATLIWNTVAGASSYKVYWGTATLTYSSDVSAGDATNYTVTGLTGGTTYYFAVTAMIDGDETVKSNEQSATMSVTTDPTNLVSDPSFEDESVDDGDEIDPSSENWTFTGNSGVIPSSLPGTFPDGFQAAFLLKYYDEMPPLLGVTDTDGAFSQSMTLSAGTYSIGFYAASAFGLSSQPIDVSMDGTSLFTVTPTTSAFKYYQGTFTISTSGSHTLSFDAYEGVAGPYASVIDDVKVLDVDEAAAPAIPTPTLYAATAQDGQVAVSFSGVPDADAYTVYWGTSPTSLTHSMAVSDTITNDSYYDANGNIIAAISQTGSATKYVYDGADRNTVTYTTDGGQVNNFSNVAIGSSTAYAAAASISDDDVLTQTTDVYDADSNIIETITADRFGTDATTATGALGTPTTGVYARVSYTASYFDAANRDVADVNVGTYGGTAWTRPSSVPSRSGTCLVTTNAYDSAGNLAFVTDPNGLITAMGYDMLGRTLVEVADWTASVGPVVVGSLPTPTDSSNQTTTYAYDGDNHVISMTAVMPSGETSQTTSYVYGVTSAQGSAINDNDILYQTIYPDPTTGEATTATSGWRFVGNAGITRNSSSLEPPSAPAGEQAGFLEGENAWISQTATFAAGSYTISFDAAQSYFDGIADDNNQTLQVLVDNVVVGIFSPGETYSSETTDSFTVAAGQHTITFKPQNGTDGYVQDDFIDGVQVNDATGTTVTPPSLVDSGFESPSIASGTYEYDPVHFNAESYTYDATGEKTSYTDRNGTTHEYAYDSLGRLITDQVTAFGPAVDETVSELAYSYDAQGNLETATSYNSSGDVVNQVLETYDGFGQLVSDAQSHYGAVADGTPTVNYTYDPTAGDRETSITDPNGRTINYDYHTGLDSVLSRVSDLSDDSGILQSYTYLGLSTPVTFTDGNGTELTYVTPGSTGVGGDQYTGLDQFGRVVDQDWVNSTDASIDEEQYGYDPDNNVLYRKNTVLTNQSELYTYDNLNRLTTFERGMLNGTDTAMTSTSTEQSWSLDALGNWQSNTVDGTTTSRINNAQNQIASVGSAALQYDSDGNLVIDQNGHAYTYDAWNRLVSVAIATMDGDMVVGIVGGSVYAYDALGRRVSEGGLNSGTSPSDLYFTNQGQVIEETGPFDGDATITDEYAWSPFYVNELIARDETVPDPDYGSALPRFGSADDDEPGYITTRLYVEQDADYNVTSLTDASGDVVERYRYDPYGNVTVLNPDGSVLGAGMASSAYGEVVGFQGGWTDPITGLLHFQHRDLNTGLGVWIEQDPARYVNGADTYQFEISNTSRGLDPSGEAILIESIGGKVTQVWPPTIKGLSIALQLAPPGSVKKITITGHGNCQNNQVWLGDFGGFLSAGISGAYNPGTWFPGAEWGVGSDTWDILTPIYKQPKGKPMQTLIGDAAGDNLTPLFMAAMAPGASLVLQACESDTAAQAFSTALPGHPVTGYHGTSWRLPFSTNTTLGSPRTALNGTLSPIPMGPTPQPAPAGAPYGNDRLPVGG